MAVHTEKLLFIHVPKTGGSSVRVILRAAGVPFTETGSGYYPEQHASLDWLRLTYRGIDEGRMSFGFVRNPVDWIKSRWAWAVETGMDTNRHNVPDAANHWLAHCWSNDFTTFIERYLERYPGVYTQNCAKLLGLWNDTKPVDYIGKTETLQDNLIEVFELSGTPYDQAAFDVVKPRRVAAHGKYADACKLSETLAARVMQAEGYICERFGY